MSETAQFKNNETDIDYIFHFWLRDRLELKSVTKSYIVIMKNGRITTIELYNSKEIRLGQVPIETIHVNK